MGSDSVISELLEFLPPERVITDASELYVYDCDGFTIARNTPRAVVFPMSTDDVVQIVKRLAARDVHLHYHHDIGA